jgi:hypothetical protein
MRGRFERKVDAGLMEMIEFEEIGLPCRRLRELSGRRLEHDPEKWVPVFGKDHAQTRS